MFRLPNRAPISYDDMRRPLNILRGLGAIAFIAAAAIGYLQTDDVAPLLVMIPGCVVVGDSVYRLRNNASAFGGLVIDASALYFAVALRGPTVTINAIAMMYLLVAGALLLPMVRAALIVGYAIVLWIGGQAFAEWSQDGFVGAIARSGLDTGFDRVAVVVLTMSVAAIMLGAINALLRAQDQQAEALAQERRAVELKNEFVSMVSHELRTPLTGIAGFTDTLNENWETLPAREVDEFLAIMSRETDHLANLVEDILVIPRLEAGQLRLDPVVLDLAVETHDVASMIFSDTADYSVTIPARVMVHADQTRLRQIMRNLIENAQKYGGDQVLIEGELSGPGSYKVSVSDNGTGVASTDQERIFKHFEQLSTGDGRLEQGVGLGLPIARTLARAMGGDLWYEDRFPVGARFCFTVQLAQEQAHPSEPAAPARGTQTRR